MFSWSETDQAKAIKFCLVGKAKRYYNEMSDDEKKDINKIRKKLKESLAKAPEFYLNLFSTRQLKPGESISSFCNLVQSLLERGMPGLEKASRDRLLRSRLIAIAPENLNNFLEMLSDKSWDDTVAILDKSADYKSINPVEIEVNRAEITASKRRIGGKFVGSCYYCDKPGHRQDKCWQKARELADSDIDPSKMASSERRATFGQNVRSKQTDFNNQTVRRIENKQAVLYA